MILFTVNKQRKSILFSKFQMWLFHDIEDVFHRFYCFKLFKTLYKCSTNMCVEKTFWYWYRCIDIDPVRNRVFPVTDLRQPLIYFWPIIDYPHLNNFSNATQHFRHLQHPRNIHLPFKNSIQIQIFTPYYPLL